MQALTQFSVFLVNKPGVLAQVIEAVAEAKINIVALTIVDSQEHGVLRIVGADAEALRNILRSLNLPTTETQVLAAELPNRPGALASALRRLADAHVNINYAYVTSGSPSGKTMGILKVSSLTKAMKLLSATPARDAKRTTVKKRRGR